MGRQPSPPDEARLGTLLGVDYRRALFAFVRETAQEAGPFVLAVLKVQSDPVTGQPLASPSIATVATKHPGLDDAARLKLSTCVREMAERGAPEWVALAFPNPYVRAWGSVGLSMVLKIEHALVPDEAWYAPLICFRGAHVLAPFEALVGLQVPHFERLHPRARRAVTVH